MIKILLLFVLLVGASIRADETSKTTNGETSPFSTPSTTIPSTTTPSNKINSISPGGPNDQSGMGMGKFKKNLINYN